MLVKLNHHVHVQNRFFMVYHFLLLFFNLPTVYLLVGLLIIEGAHFAEIYSNFTTKSELSVVWLDCRSDHCYVVNRRGRLTINGKIKELSTRTKNDPFTCNLLTRGFL